jgi:catechol 2,3-dioxygenase-like lactoylglutathione lyase family enzyme
MRWKSEDEMRKPTVCGVHHVKLPVSDIVASRAFYEDLFTLNVLHDFLDGDGGARGVAYAPIGGVSLGLREDPVRATAQRGYDPLAFSVEDNMAIHAWIAHLGSHGIPVTGPAAGTTGLVVGFDDPDGITIVLYSSSPAS